MRQCLLLAGSGMFSVESPGTEMIGGWLVDNTQNGCVSWVIEGCSVPQH